jgi:hypothetical integral membrane protein (TIGR02206 family)
VPAYGVSQILWLIGIAGTAAALCVLCCGKRLSHPVVRGVLACGLAAAEIERTLRDGMHFPDQMPFNLCNVSTWMAVFALATLRPLAVEFVYFAGLTGAAMALLTPDTWPVRFFINHGGTVIAATVLVFGRVGRIRRGAVWRSLGLLGIYAALLGTFDWAFGTNYGYLCRKPRGATLMSLMGPWPWYLGSAALLALALFWLLWIPVRRSAS